MHMILIKALQNYFQVMLPLINRKIDKEEVTFERPDHKMLAAASSLVWDISLTYCLKKSNMKIAHIFADQLPRNTGLD